MSHIEQTCPLIDKRVIDNVFGKLSAHPNEYFYRKNSMDVILIVMDVIREIIKKEKPGNVDFEIGKTLQGLKNSNLMGTTFDKMLNGVNIRKTPFFSINASDKLINHVNCGSRLNNLRPIAPIFQYVFSVWHCDGNRDNIVKSCSKEGSNLYSFEESIAGMLTLSDIRRKTSLEEQNNLMLIILYGLAFASEVNISTFELKEDKIRFRDLGQSSLIRLGTSDNPFAYIKTRYVPLIIDFSTCIIADLDDYESITEKDKKRVDKDKEKERIANGGWSRSKQVGVGILIAIFIIVILIVLAACAYFKIDPKGDSSSSSDPSSSGSGFGNVFSDIGHGGLEIGKQVGSAMIKMDRAIGSEFIREITNPVYYPFGSHGFGGQSGSHYGGGYGSWEFGLGYKSTPLLDLIGSIDHVEHSTTYQSISETVSEKYARLKNDIEYLRKMFDKGGFSTEIFIMINNSFNPHTNI
jgi:hypothetical protein